ncbi:OmpA family protein [uncultured Winogradskyella sp.]|uniref:OmpA family protein n=1 Tax=uncultured Winogradskyella sp. TaxID=395353 RepID=UPI002624ECFA|nr:OmpA family protein [uncultured Winogradskyella sp.]
MKTINTYIIICSLILLSGLGYAQKGNIKKADKNFENLAYIDAIEVYEAVANKGYEDADIFKHLGDANYFNANYSEASKWYGKLYDLQGEQGGDYNFRFGQSLKAIGDYQKADVYLERFYKSKGENYVKASNVLSAIENVSYRYLAEKARFNTTYSDYPAYYNNDTLYVVSANSGDLKTPWNNQPTSDIFLLNKSSLSELGGDVNSKYNEGSIAMTKDGETLYFTRNDYHNKKLGKDGNKTTRLKLYRAQKIDGKWTNIEELPFNNSEYSTGHPALSNDESKLYFVSDMPGNGSKGGTDIYETEIYDDGSFGAVFNMAGFNTPGNEMFPFVASDGSFYFASNGQIYNLGGLDIYQAKPNSDGVYGKVENLGEPINSTMDDFAFVIDAKKKSGYFATNREDSASDDIFSFTENDGYVAPCIVDLKGVVRDKKTGDILENTLVSLIGADNTIISQKVAPAGLYDFSEVDCNKVKFIRAEKNGYQTNEESVNEPVDGVSRMDILLDKRTHGVTDGSDIANLILKPIYFDLDKSNIRPDAEIELQKVIAVMQLHPNLKIDVRSHTDSRANDNYNMHLSDRRVKATIDYLVNNGGISQSRLTGRGYGESQLKNSCYNGTNCSEYEHQQNRRSEFIVNN